MTNMTRKIRLVGTTDAGTERGMNDGLHKNDAR